ncbi:MAG: hypothetical protein HRF50_02770 [Phycisphaerae bacterium]|jgi:hypothetical protein
MPDPAGHPARHGESAPVRVVHGAERLVLWVVKRIYALLLIAIILWLSWKAFEYLLVSLILPTPPPAQVVDIPTRLDRSVLERGPAAFSGVLATENPRLPPAHYHRFDTWFQPDRFNDCTRSGCHAPLPHNARKEDRAFLNMHATSIHCGVCHLRSETTPLKLTWYDLATGRPVAAPALLAAYAWLTERPERAPDGWTSAEQKEIVGLLRAAGASPAIAGLADHLAAVRAESEEFARLVGLARDIVPRHFRGEYGAKLALRDGAGRPRLAHEGTEAAVRRYLEPDASRNDAERKRLLAEVHPQRREPTLTCTNCHRAEGSLVELHSVGYPPRRVQDLMRPMVMQAIEHIMQGQPFYMPQFMPERPATRPDGE